MDVNNEMSKFTHSEAGDIRRLPHRWQRTVDAFGGILSRSMRTSAVFFYLLVRVVISGKIINTSSTM